MADRRCLLLFAKPSRPGRVKTRLIGELDAFQAAQLHDAFLRDLTERLHRGAFDLWLAWGVEGEEGLPAGELTAIRQEGQDLGERLYRGLSRAARRYSAVLAVGSDHPELELSTVHRAFEALEAGADIVLGPAEDGGYYLVGATARTLDPDLFRGIPWSTDGVLGATLQRCRERGLRVAVLDPGYDVDTPDDLQRLVRHLAEGDLDCPRTRRLLAGWDRLPAA